MFFKLAFETFEEGKGVSGGTGKTGDDLAVVQATNFFALPFITVLPRETWPSPPMTTLP
jgi:hypothetical protein